MKISFFFVSLILTFSLQNFAQHSHIINMPTKDIIDSTLSAHAKSKKYIDWKASEFHPEKLTAILSQEKTKDLCSQLVSRSYKDQLIFFETIQIGSLKNAECTSLLSDLETYLKNSSDKLLQKVRRKSDGKQSPPSEVRYINPTGGGFYVEADLKDREITLTFDDGPNPQTTSDLIKILTGYNVFANFFVVGQRVEQHADVVRHAEEAGHYIGNHSWDHEDLSRLSLSEAMENIDKKFCLDR
ncbi:MAG: polysaccharide deacetylase family protein [Bdellovibrionales bacterium]